MTIRDFLAVHSPRIQPLRRYLEQREDVSSVEESNGWLVAHGCARGSKGHLAEPRPASDGLQVLVGPGALLQSTAERRRFRRCLAQAPDQLATFRGDFTAVLLERGGVAHFARACSGVPPLYIASTSNEAFISTRLDWLARLLATPLQPDWLPIAVYLTGWASFPEQRSFLRGISRPETGSAGRVQVGGSLSTQRYWFPERLDPEPTTLEAASAQLREVVLEQLRRTLDPRGDNLLLFSGGVDSACLAALAHTLELPLHAASMLPPATDLAHAREQRFVHGLPEAFRSHHVVPADAAGILELLEPTSRLGLPVNAGWAVLSSWGGRPTTGTVLTGWFADECWGAHRFVDWVEGRSLGELPHHLRFTRHPVVMLARWAGLLPTPTLTLPVQLAPFLPRGVRAEYQQWIEQGDAEARLVPRRVRQLDLRRRRSDFTGVYSEAAALLGYEALCPFASREVVEQAYRLAPRLCFERGLNKLPLRHAVPELPLLYARRADKGGNHVATNYEGLISPGDLHPRVREWVDKAARADHDARGILSSPAALVASWVLSAIDGWEYERTRREHTEASHASAAR